mmetsp:Transcript_13894/g.26981  ORF Transcript_13894/g.26981 Transcript_13894/m.26981 type:complete len:296 (-) Transcript_13894:305-1192(-)
MSAPWVVLEWMGETSARAPSTEVPALRRKKRARAGPSSGASPVTTRCRGGGLAQDLAKAVVGNLSALNSLPMHNNVQGLLERAVTQKIGVRDDEDESAGNALGSGSSSSKAVEEAPILENSLDRDDIQSSEEATNVPATRRSMRNASQTEPNDESEKHNEVDEKLASEHDISRARIRVQLAEKTHDLVQLYRQKLQRDLSTLYKVLGVPPLTPSSSHRQHGLQVGPPASLEDLAHYCVCKQLYLGSMIACDRKDCSVEWFHCECAGIPPGENPPNFVCHVCQAGVDDKRRKKTKK